MKNKIKNLIECCIVILATISMILTYFHFEKSGTFLIIIVLFIVFTLRIIEWAEKNLNKHKEEINTIVSLNPNAEQIQSYLDSKKSEIENLTQAAENALGRATDVAMVRTFSQETTMQRCVHGFMFCLSIGILGLMLWLGFDTIKLITNPSIMNNKASEIVKVKDGKISNTKMSHNDSVDITLLIMRGLLFIPLGLGFWMANKKSDKAALLSAEYRHKKAVIEAMLGYRAQYQSSQDQFSDGFKREYEKFFDATFAEINRNPADKINKMIKENNFKIEDIKDLIKIIKSKD